VDTKDYIMNPRFTLLVQKSKLHPRRPQTAGGFKKCFEEQAQAHEKALRTPNSTLFGSQDGRQDLGKADTPSNTKADLKKTLRTPDSTQFVEKQTETTRHKGKQEDRQAGRRAGRQERQERQDLGKAGTPSNTGTHVGETIRDNGRHWDMGTQWERRRTHHPSRRYHPTQAHMWEDNGRETMRDKTSGRRTHHSTQAHMWGDNGKQWDTRGDNGRQCETMGDNGRQGETRCEKRRETMGDKRRQDLEKADTPSNTGARVGRQLTIGNKGPTQAHAGRQWET